MLIFERFSIVLSPHFQLRLLSLSTDSELSTELEIGADYKVHCSIEETSSLTRLREFYEIGEGDPPAAIISVSDHHRIANWHLFFDQVQIDRLMKALEITSHWNPIVKVEAMPDRKHKMAKGSRVHLVEIQPSVIIEPSEP